LRRLFLASDGLGALPVLLGDDLSSRDVAFVVTPSIPLEDRAYVEGDHKRLEEFGLRVHPVDVGQRPFIEALHIIEGSDLIVVTGGDVFYLMSKARESGFDRLLAKRVEDGTPYVGMSAGAILVGPSLAR
jgi:dipeptidase E